MYTPVIDSFILLIFIFRLRVVYIMKLMMTIVACFMVCALVVLTFNSVFRAILCMFCFTSIRTKPLMT